MGANDHGKTNLLLAIAALNDDVNFTEEDDLSWDYMAKPTIFLNWDLRLSLTTGNVPGLQKITIRITRPFAMSIARIDR